MLTSTIPLSTTLANISRETNNNDEYITPTILSISAPIPTLLNQDPLDSTASKGNTPFSTSQGVITSSNTTNKAENDIHSDNDHYELHTHVSPNSTFNIRHNVSFNINDIGFSFLSTLSPPVVSNNIVFSHFHAAVFQSFHMTNIFDSASIYPGFTSTLIINEPCIDFNGVSQPFISTIMGRLLTNHANPSRNLATDANKSLSILYSNKQNSNSLDKQGSNKKKAKRTRIYPARKETSVVVVTNKCFLAASVVKGFIFYTPQLINLQSSYTTRYDFRSSSTKVISFLLSILDISDLPTKYMLVHNNNIVNETTSHLEHKDFMLSTSSVACMKYFINLQTSNMKFKVINDGSLAFRSKVLFFGSGTIFSDNNTNYIKVHYLFERVAPMDYNYTPILFCSKNSFSEAVLKEKKLMQDNNQQKKIRKLTSTFIKNKISPRDIVVCKISCLTYCLTFYGW